MKMNFCYIFVLFIGVLVPYCVGQGLQCNVLYVTVNQSDPNDLVFENFPTGQESPFEPYEPGSFGAWYEIAGGIIRVVRPGSVTESKRMIVTYIYIYIYIYITAVIHHSAFTNTSNN